MLWGGGGVGWRLAFEGHCNTLFVTFMLHLTFTPLHRRHSMAVVVVAQPPRIGTSQAFRSKVHSHATYVTITLFLFCYRLRENIFFNPPFLCLPVFWGRIQHRHSISWQVMASELLVGCSRGESMDYKLRMAWKRKEYDELNW